MAASSNDGSIPLENLADTAVPWSLSDTWIGLALLVLIQVAIVLAVLIFKPSKVYGTASVILLELIYLFPVGIILGCRQVNWRWLGYRKFNKTSLEIGCGLLVAAYFITFINNSIFLMLGKDVQANEVIRLLGALPSPYSFIFTGVVLAPFVEETFFRGFLFAGFRRRYGWNKAAWLSSAFFAMAHLQLAALIPTFMLGYSFSYLYHKSNSLWPGIFMHFLVNAFGLSAIFAFMHLGGSIHL